MPLQKKIFISYSHDSQEHKDKVLKLASLLYSHGAEVFFDQFNLQYGNDLPLFMEQGLTKSDYVLIICSDLYTKKANEGIGGIGYENVLLGNTIIY
ncbi:toll/interleukin-1 receptor domain-containing protein [Anaerocaecibacter muris]|uniref:toll/interleukin-1 receptor domain-containing protein n=1 Tax=Anaerocaecibacter muris TaxID=2941513 RepID=UPI003F6925DD